MVYGLWHVAYLFMKTILQYYNTTILQLQLFLMALWIMDLLFNAFFNAYFYKYIYIGTIWVPINDLI